MRKLAWLGACGLVVVACSATRDSELENDDGPTTTTTTVPGTGGSTSSGGTFATGTGGGPTQGCSEPGCIGATPQGECDSGLAIGSSDAMDGARAIGLCQVAEGDSWGVVSASWVRSDGQPLQGGDGGLLGDGTTLDKGKGILTDFGPMQPREGASMLVLSSGSARAPGDPDYADPGGNWKDSFPHSLPSGFQPDSGPDCNVESGEPYDSAGLRLTIKTPLDAKSFRFEFDFYTYEYPDYICDVYNDFFVALLSPAPAGFPDGNISFDMQGNSISVNAGFLQACTPTTAGGKNFSCPLGYSEIVGTGFDSNDLGFAGSAATSWLETTSPVENPGGEITLDFAIWDSADGVLDSTVLIDNFRFELEEGMVGTAPVPR